MFLGESPWKSPSGLIQLTFFSFPLLSYLLSNSLKRSLEAGLEVPLVQDERSCGLQELGGPVHAQVPTPPEAEIRIRAPHQFLILRGRDELGRDDDADQQLTAAGP